MGAEAKAARGPGPSQKQKKRAARRKNRLAEGKLEQTDKTVEELMRIEGLVAFAVEDCQDEAELRGQFHSQGTAGPHAKYFEDGKYSFKFLLAKDGTPVAQIVEAYSLKIPNFLRE